MPKKWRSLVRAFCSTSGSNTLFVAFIIIRKAPYRIVRVNAIPLLFKPLRGTLYGCPNSFVNLAPLGTRIQERSIAQRKSPPLPALNHNGDVRRLQPLEVIYLDLPRDAR